MFYLHLYNNIIQKQIVLFVLRIANNFFLVTWPPSPKDWGPIIDRVNNVWTALLILEEIQWRILVKIKSEGHRHQFKGQQCINSHTPFTHPYPDA